MKITKTELKKLIKESVEEEKDFLATVEPVVSPDVGSEIEMLKFNLFASMQLLGDMSREHGLEPDFDTALYHIESAYRKVGDLKTEISRLKNLTKKIKSK